MNFEVNDIDTAHMILDQSSEIYAADLSEDTANIFGFDRLEISKDKNGRGYLTKVKNDGIFSLSYRISVAANKVIVLSYYPFRPVLLVTLWVMIIVFAIVHGFTMSPLYPAYTAGKVDYWIMAVLAAILVITGTYFPAKWSSGKKVIRAFITEKIVRPVNRENPEKKQMRLGDIKNGDIAFTCNENGTI